MDEIRSLWKVPSIGHFCSLFRETFNLPEFDIEELEDALVASVPEGGCDFLTDLVCRLLNGYHSRTDIVPSNYDLYLKDLFRSHYEIEGRGNNPLEDTDFDLLPIATKVDVLHELCDYRLYEDGVEDQLRGVDSNNLRLIPLGWDKDGAAYWYFYGTRLYKELPKRKRDDNKKRKSKGEVKETPKKTKTTKKILEKQRQAERERRVKERERIKQERSKRKEMREARAQLIAAGEEIPPELMYNHASMNKSFDAEDLDEEMITSLYKVYDCVKMHKDSWPFWEPVNTEVAPDYYEVIKNPIDLSTIDKKLEQGAYTSRHEFISDFKLMFDNCYTYNGRRNQLSLMAHCLDDELSRALDRYAPDIDYSCFDDDISTDYYVSNRLCPKRAASTRARKIVHRAAADIRGRYKGHDTSSDDDDTTNQSQSKKTPLTKSQRATTVLCRNSDGTRSRVKVFPDGDVPEILSPRSYATKTINPNNFGTNIPLDPNKVMLYKDPKTGVFSLVNSVGKTTTLKLVEGKTPIVMTAGGTSTIGTQKVMNIPINTGGVKSPDISDNDGTKMQFEKIGIGSQSGNILIIKKAADGNAIRTPVINTQVLDSFPNVHRDANAEQKLPYSVVHVPNTGGGGGGSQQTSSTIVRLHPIPPKVSVACSQSKAIPLITQNNAFTKDKPKLFVMHPSVEGIKGMTESTSITALQRSKPLHGINRSAYENEFLSFSQKRPITRVSTGSTAAITDTNSSNSNHTQKPPSILPVYVSKNQPNKTTHFRKLSGQGSFNWDSDPESVDNNAGVDSEPPELPTYEPTCVKDTCNDDGEISNGSSSDLQNLLNKLEARNTSVCNNVDGAQDGLVQNQGFNKQLSTAQDKILTGLSSILKNVNSPLKCRTKSVSFNDNAKSLSFQDNFIKNCKSQNSVERVSSDSQSQNLVVNCVNKQNNSNHGHLKTAQITQNGENMSNIPNLPCLQVTTEQPNGPNCSPPDLEIVVKSTKGVLNCPDQFNSSDSPPLLHVETIQR